MFLFLKPDGACTFLSIFRLLLTPDSWPFVLVENPLTGADQTISHQNRPVARPIDSPTVNQGATCGLLIHFHSPLLTNISPLTPSRTSFTSKHFIPNSYHFIHDDAPFMQKYPANAAAFHFHDTCPPSHEAWNTHHWLAIESWTRANRCIRTKRISKMDQYIGDTKVIHRCASTNGTHRWYIGCGY